LFSLPPVVRLISSGIRQESKELREGGISFGATRRKMRHKAKLLVALPTTVAGINKTFMLAFEMVLIAEIIGGGGLGREVLLGFRLLSMDKTLQAGIAIAIVAIFLDRTTRVLGRVQRKQK
jgi:ABC-type proline/glycine betaine transport system permease subunit